MTRLSITVDEELVEKARELAEVRTKREAIELALREYVNRRRIEKLTHLRGSDIIDWTPESLRAWRDMSIIKPWPDDE